MGIHPKVKFQHLLPKKIIKFLCKRSFFRVFQGVQEHEIMFGDGHILVEAENKVGGDFVNDVWDTSNLVEFFQKGRTCHIKSGQVLFLYSRHGQ